MEFITLKELRAELNQLNDLRRKASDSYRKDLDKAAKLDQQADLIQEKIQDRIDEFKKHDVIKILSVASDAGISPQYALGDWIESWC